MTVDLGGQISRNQSGRSPHQWRERHRTPQFGRCAQQTKLGNKIGFVDLGRSRVRIARTNKAKGIRIRYPPLLERNAPQKGVSHIAALHLARQVGGNPGFHKLEAGPLVLAGQQRMRLRRAFDLSDLD